MPQRGVTDDRRPHGDALALATRLVHEAPMLAPASVAALSAALSRDGTSLAIAISRVLTGVVDGAIDAGIALPEIAEACAALEIVDARARHTARYRLETLMPVARVDVPADRLRRQT